MEQRFSQAEPRLSASSSSFPTISGYTHAGKHEWLERKGAHGPARRLTITNANGRDELIYLLLIDWPLVVGASRRCEPGRISTGAEEGRGGRSEQYAGGGGGGGKENGGEEGYFSRSLLRTGQ